MEDYKPNSNRFKDEQKNKLPEKKVEKVVTGKVVTRKKSVFSKLSDEFISEDAKNVKTYVLGEVLIPAIKKAISDIVTDGIDMILYGGSRGTRNRSTVDRVSYSSYSNRSSGVRDYRATARRYSYDDIIFANRADAEDVLTNLDELIDNFGLVRVADLFDLAGKTCDYTANKYGWTSIRSAEVVRVRDGYLIKMPPAIPID